jgi:hypothetical protein
MRFSTLQRSKEVCKLLRFGCASLEIRFSEMCLNLCNCVALIWTNSDFGGSLFFINK